MKQIFPIKDNKSLSSINEIAITKEDYDNLVKIVNDLKSDFNKAIIDINAFESGLANQVTTKNIDSDTADIDTLNTNKLSADSLQVNTINDFIDLLKKEINNESLSVKFNNDSFIIEFDKNKSIWVRPDSIILYKDTTIDGNLNTKDITADNLTLEKDLIVNGHVTYKNPPEQINANLKGNTSAEVIDSNTINTNELNADSIISKEVTSDKVISDDVYARAFINGDYTSIAHNYHKHEPQQVDASYSEYFIDIPNFKNGEYYLMCERENYIEGEESVKLFSFEAFNSIDNPMFRWSEDKINRIEKVYLGKYSDGTARVILKVNNEIDLNKIYCASNSFEIKEYSTGWNSPTIFEHFPADEEDFKVVEITSIKGTYLPNATYAGEFHAEDMVVDQFIFDKLFVNDSIGFSDNPTDPESGFNVGQTGQYITNTIHPNELNKTRPNWVDPVKYKGTITSLDYSESDQPLITADRVANWNGTSEEWNNGYSTTIVEAYDLIDSGKRLQYSDGGEWLDLEIEKIDDETYKFKDTERSTTYKLFVRIAKDNIIYPITNLGDNTEVHGDIQIDNNLNVDNDATIQNNLTINGVIKSKHFLDGTSLDDLEFPDNEDALVNVDDKWYRKRSFTEEGAEVNKLDEVAVKNSDADWENHDTKPIVYNKDRDSLEPADSLTIDDITVDNATINNNLDVGNDVRISGDLFVSGTTHTVNEEVIESKSDTIILREGATHALMPGQESGLIINNIDGNGSDLSIVTDEEGTLRIGVAKGTNTTYTDVAFNSHTDKWYSIDKSVDPYTYTELDPQPKGELTDEQNKVEDDPYTEYDSVTFTEIDKTSLQPFLTRQETSDMNDQGLLKYNTSSEQTDTIPLPTINGQRLRADYTDNKWTYSWDGTQDPRIFRFATYEEYEQALEITEGNEGYIPSGSLIIIEGNYDNLMEA